MTPPTSGSRWSRVGKLFSLRGARVRWEPRHWTALTAWLVIAFLGTVVLTFLDYGVTYDEEVHSRYGDMAVAWYASGFRDRDALTFFNLHHYGAFIEIVGNLLGRATPLGLYETRHLLTALFAALGLVGTYKAGRALGGPAAGFVAALVLVLTPRFYGHAFHNFKDVPFAVLSIWSVYYMIEAVRHMPSVPRSVLVKLGVVTGLALGIRVGAVLLVAYTGLAFTGWLAAELFLRPGDGGERPELKPLLRRLVPQFLTVCLVAYPVMLVWWPAAQASPILKPLRSLRYATKFQYTFEVLFDGGMILTSELPWTYLPTWFAITMPEFLMVMLATGVALGAVALPRMLRDRSADGRARLIGTGVLLTAALFPIAYTVARRPVTYDGIRHFLFVLPPLAVASGLAAVALARRFGRGLPTLAFGAVCAGSMALTAVDMVRLHPYQYIYFNRALAGGLPGASQGFETEYWGGSNKEAVEWIAEHYERPADGRPVKVASTLDELTTSYYFPIEGLEYIGSYHDGAHTPDEEPDVYMANTRWDGLEIRTGRVVHTISRMDVPLVYIMDRLDPPPEGD